MPSCARTLAPHRLDSPRAIERVYGETTEILGSASTADLDVLSLQDVHTQTLLTCALRPASMGRGHHFAITAAAPKTDLDRTGRSFTQM